MKILRNMKPNAWSWLLLVLLIGLATKASAGPITYTFTATGNGTIGATNLTSALVTVTAIGDTGAISLGPQPPYPPNVFFIVPTQFTVSISGVGTANFTGAGHFGGNGYVFDSETQSLGGFGIESDNGDINGSAFATYALASYIDWATFRRKYVL